MAANPEHLWRSLVSRTDQRGTLTIAEVDGALPFMARRAYWIAGTPAAAVRGRHAHFRLHQFLVPSAGGCTVELDDGTGTVSLRLDDPARGLHVPPYVWHTLRDFTPDCVLTVLADAPYDAEDYIHDHVEFLRLVAERNRQP